MFQRHLRSTLKVMLCEEEISNRSPTWHRYSWLANILCADVFKRIMKIKGINRWCRKSVQSLLVFPLPDAFAVCVSVIHRKRINPLLLPSVLANKIRIHQLYHPLLKGMTTCNSHSCSFSNIYPGAKKNGVDIRDFGGRPPPQSIIRQPEEVHLMPKLSMILYLLDIYNFRPLF